MKYMAIILPGLGAEHTLGISSVLKTIRKPALSLERMKPFLAFVLALAVVFASPSLFANSGHSCDALVGSAVPIQIENEGIAKNGFNYSRNLDQYNLALAFGPSGSIKNTVLQLPAGAVWIDMGAGLGVALLDGLKANPKIQQAVAIAYKDPAEIDSIVTLRRLRHFKRFTYISGDYVENLASSGKLNHLKGAVDFITDVYGPLSYSKELPRLLQIYINLLKVNGVLAFNMMTGLRMIQEQSSDASVAINTFTDGRADSDANANFEVFMTWLRSIPGIEVLETTDVTYPTPRVWEDSFAVKVRKVHAEVVVPTTLELKSYTAGSPPIRNYEIHH